MSAVNSYPNVDADDILEAIAQFYSFFERMQQLRNDIEDLAVDDQKKIRILDQLEGVEKEYKDSQEWILPRSVQDVRVGVIGTERSLKSAVVSLFVEGVLEIEGDMKDGRTKTKIPVDGKYRLLLVREETGRPSKQLCQWADVLLLVFSYSDDESLSQIADFYRLFRETRSDAPVMLVGVKGYPLSPSLDDQVSLRRPVKEGDVRKTVELLEKCTPIDVTLSHQSANSLFTQACRLALNSPSFSNCLTTSTSMSQCSVPTTFPSSPSQSSLSQPAKLSGGMPASPSHSKARSNKRKSMFGGSNKGSYNLTKSALESFGSGRPVPVKEGHINKKSAGGLRAEWKKKYLVLSKTELTYYPSLNDYMSMSHGKTLKLQQITVKVPGQHVSSVSRPTATPPSTELTESLAITSQQGNISDRSNSTSPPPYTLESSLDMSCNSNMSGTAGYTSLPAYPRITHTSPQHVPPPVPPHTYYHNQHHHDNHGRSNDLQLGHEIRDYRSPASSERDEFGSSDPIEEAYPGLRYDMYTNGRGHNRNGSVDDTVMLQQLRTGGITYIPVIEEDRSATMSRIETKKNKKGGLQMNVLPASSEEMLEGSQESLGRFERDKKKKGEKGERYSMLLSDRTMSESAKDKSTFEKRSKGHKRQRSWGGNKLLEVEGAAEALAECCEFQVLSSDNKVWSFDAASSEDASAWVKAIEDQIKKIISESVSHKRVNSVTDFEKKEIINVEGNGFCADCNAPNPEWGSLNHGCLLCIECSGVHRNLGSHISRVRSLALDEWSPELISVMLNIGNKLSHNLWEAKKPKSRPLHSTATREEREKFIKAKYIDKEFLADLPRTDKPVHLQLMDAVKTNNITGCLNILAHATPEDINTLHEQPEGWAPLHVACMLGKTIILQLLIWNGGDVNILDADKHSPIYYARQNGHQEAVQILIANSCIDDSSDTGSMDATQQSAM